MAPVQRSMQPSAAVAQDDPEMAALEAMMMADSGAPVALMESSKKKSKKRAASPVAEYQVEESKAPMTRPPIEETKTTVQNTKPKPSF